jgi:hypothetical protein
MGTDPRIRIRNNDAKMQEAFATGTGTACVDSGGKFSTTPMANFQTHSKLS